MAWFSSKFELQRCADIEGSHFSSHDLRSIHIITYLFLAFVKFQGKAMAIALQPTQEVTATRKPLINQRRVVVTGLGAVTPLGHDPDVFYNNLLDGVSGISEINAFDCAEYPTVNDVFSQTSFSGIAFFSF